MPDHSDPPGGASPQPAPFPDDFDLGSGKGAQFTESSWGVYLSFDEADRIVKALNIPKQAGIQNLMQDLNTPGQSGIQVSNVSEQVSTEAGNFPERHSAQANNIPEHPITLSEDDNTFFNSLGAGINDEFHLPQSDRKQVESGLFNECSSLTMQFDGISDSRRSVAPADQGCLTPDQEATASNMQHVNHAHEVGNQREQHNEHDSTISNLIFIV